MKQVTVQLDTLVRPEKNIRIHTEKQLKEFERSIRMFGQLRPLVIDEKNMILAGNGLYEALVRLGWSEALAYQYDELTDAQKKKLMVADNRIFSLGVDNLDTLNSFLEELSNDLDIPGFDEDILQQMVADADEVTEKIAEYGTLDDEEIQSIRENSEKHRDPLSVLRSSPMSEHPDFSEESPEQMSSVTFKTEKEEKNLSYVICPKCGEQIWL